MRSSLSDAYRMLAAESAIWAMPPAHLEALAVTLARGDKLAVARRGAAPAMQPGAVAIIPILGPLSRRSSLLMSLLGLTEASTYQGIARNLAGALADREVKQIMLMIDSPGGTVGGLPELADDIARAGRIKPVIAVADGLAASAAFWLATQAGRFVATPSAEVGSVGVYLLHVDASRMVDAAGLTPTFIASKISPAKVEANPLEPLTEEARDFLQGEVDKIGNRFVRGVARGRGVSESTVIARFGRGRIVLAPDAKRAGMIDEIQTFDQALSQSLGPQGAGAAGLVTPSRASLKHNPRHRRLALLKHGLTS